MCRLFPVLLLVLAACSPQAAKPPAEQLIYAGGSRDRLCLAGERGGFIVYGEGDANCMARGRVDRTGDRLVLSTAATHGVPIALVERNAVPAPSPLLKSSEAASIAALDHVVVRSPHPERAIAFYAGRLGLDLRLDRSNPAWGSRLLFFRCGDLVVEIAHDLNKGVSDAPDQLWGLSWRTPDVAKANERLKKAGVEVSEPRDGRRPGTQVFTVQSHNANVPTIVIGGREHWP